MHTPAITLSTNRRAFLFTLGVAYIGFTVLGIVNSLMGVAWPSIQSYFGLPVDALGLLLIGNTASYMVASTICGRLIARWGLGLVLTCTCSIAGLALISASSATTWPMLIACNVAYGTCSGILDASINSYAANHFSPRAINWLHASFGVGATLGPAMMTIVLSNHLSWRVGFAIAAATQIALSICFAFTRRRWQTAQVSTSNAQAAESSARLAETLRLPRAWLGILIFFVYCGAEVGTGQWVYSLLTELRGVPTTLAGSWLSLYWASLTCGRILFGIVVGYISPTKLLRWSIIGGLLAAVLIWQSSFIWLTFGGIALMGMALAPQFPLLIASTPRYLGTRHAANGVGLQVAAASLGGGVLPALIGILARMRDLEVLGPCLFVIVLIMALLFEVLARQTPTTRQVSATESIAD